MGVVSEFMELLRRGSAELFVDHPDRMDCGELLSTVNVIDPGDIELFYAGVEAGLIALRRGARCKHGRSADRGRAMGSAVAGPTGGWYHAEYLPQLAAYVDAILHRGYLSSTR